MGIKRFSSGESADGVTLAEWGKGVEGDIVEIVGTSRLVTRLREMGLVPGRRIRKLRKGCPVVIQIGETRLCMRRGDAAAVRVRPRKTADRRAGSAETPTGTLSTEESR